MRRARRAIALGALLALGAAPAAAHATDGALYPDGASAWAVRPGVAATVQAGPVYLLQVPALSPAGTGNYFEMNWGCPVPGSEIAAVHFGALRTQAPSSMAIEVTGNRQVLWSESDAGMPQSPALGRAYGILLPGGQCNVHLALSQKEVRGQHARGYFIDNPRVLVRDVAPPSAVLRHAPAGWIGGGAGSARIDWSAGDNFGSDGIGLQQISVAGHVRWAGTPGAGDHSADVPLDGIGDGVHRVEVSVAGDGTGAASAAGVIHLDRTPPAVADLAAGAQASGAAVLRWSVADALSGVGGSEAQVNAAGDGSGAGAWETLATAGGPGVHGATVPVGVPDGVHAWRVVASDGAGNVGATAAPDRILVNTTPPSLELHDVPSGWVRRLELDLTATDNLQGALGLGTTQIDVNAAADGGEGGPWLSRSTGVAAPGRRVVPIELAGLADGRHVVRVHVRNGGPFGDALAAERRTTVRVNRSPPQIARAAFAPGAGTLTASWVADDALAGVETATLQWRDGATWRTLAGQGASDGAGSMTVNASAVPLGHRVFRIVAADAAGNAAVRQGEARLERGGAGSAAADPTARLRNARLSLSVARARVGRVAGRRALIARIAAGGSVSVAGRLRDARGRPIAGAEIRARGHRGALVGRALTGRDGRFRLVARPLAGGPLRIGVPAGRELLPARAPAAFVEVRPRVSLAASTATAWGGQEVQFSGRLFPAPADLGLGSRKGIVLEWRDPLRGTWRPVVNARINRDGTFAIPWTFNLRGLTIPMRVSVPTEVGWPLLPVRSGVIALAVR